VVRTSLHAIAISVAAIANVARADLVPVEIKGPPRIIVDTRPASLPGKVQAAPEWSCYTPCVLMLPRGSPWIISVRGKQSHSNRSKLVAGFEAPSTVTIDPVSSAARWTSLGFAVGVSAGFGFSLGMWAVSSSFRGEDANSHQDVVKGAAISMGVHAALVLIAWPIAFTTRTTIDVRRTIPKVSVAPNAAALTWTF
jgi:hypothetical protein